jgi:hypothetical protein
MIVVTLGPHTKQHPAEHVAPDNRDALYREIKGAVIPLGLIAYVDDRPGVGLAAPTGP